MQDLQKEKLYEWEEEWKDWDRNTLKLKEMRATVRWACKKYHVSTPQVRQHKTREWSWYKDGTYRGGTAKISFQHGQSNPAIALHETAHHIIYEICGETVEDHGREFLGVYLWLLIEAKVAPASALYPSARTASLRFLSVEAASPLRFRRVYLKAPS